VIMEKSKKAQA